METKNRFWAIAFIGIGILMIFGRWTNFFTLAALVLLLYGVYKIRQGTEVRTGYMLLAVGCGIILIDHFMLVLVICLISLGLFYAKSKQMKPDHNDRQKHNFIEGVHWDRDPWVLRNLGMWHVLGELDIDLSLAIVEETQNTLILQGIVGDVDLSISEDYGIEIEAFVLFGRIQMGREQETGMVNRIYWRSPNYEQREQKVKIVISYLVGDVDIKFPF
ncbi:hypothetical protein DCC85_18270 [Paenibacillus sp. CAA11]|uniref:cell wall-active antibiotics response protein LiaF n=1 Tax=Paenibacillus sp. CAA11 TaxID=1532905 RepID=UPI000D35AF6A|nr:cell wall-active antibiotics response protein LiaF [Paenibacillus sp. CAA11]AWB45942.1 hypothetical protein DCC85_18270 [Paenibacillus sp. CAA11]